MTQQRILISLLAACFVLLAAIVWRGYVAERNGVVYLGEPDRSEDLTLEQSRRLGGTEVSTIEDVNEKLPYETALARYRNRTITFSDSCEATPVALAVRVKDKIMLDNRSGGDKRIRFGSRGTTIESMDFIVISFPKPGQVYFSCGGYENVAVVGITQ